MGLGPIPASLIRRHIETELGIDDVDEAERAFAIIRLLDDEYLRLSSPGKSADDPEMRSRVPVDDVAGVRSLVKELGKPKAKTAATKTKPKKT